MKALLVQELATAVLGDAAGPALRAAGGGHGSQPDQGPDHDPGGFGLHRRRRRASSAIDNWSVEKIKRAGGDAVKVLAWYRPDADPAVCAAQQDFTRAIGDACAAYDIPFVFELLVYPLPGDGDQTTRMWNTGRRTPNWCWTACALVGGEFGIDVFKLESPVPAETVPDPDGEERGCRAGPVRRDGAAGRPALGDAVGGRRQASRQARADLRLPGRGPAATSPAARSGGMRSRRFPTWA